MLHDGVFFAATKLYGITFAERADLAGYNDDVRVFEVFEADGTPLGLFLADFYTRPGKSGGAWMQSMHTPNDIDGTRPVVTNNMNVTKPPAGQPTLLTLDEVRDAVPRVRARAARPVRHGPLAAFAGTRSPRDFVEFPSQVNEMWMLWPGGARNYARHIETGEPLPAEVVEKLHASTAFNEGFATTEYLAASLLDLAWHTLAAGEEVDDVVDFEAAALAKAGVAVDAVPPRYRSGYFAHIFSDVVVQRGLLLLHLERDPRRRHGRVVQRQRRPDPGQRRPLPARAARPRRQRRSDGGVPGVPGPRRRDRPAARPPQAGPLAPTD